jgi:hypothetical protein
MSRWLHSEHTDGPLLRAAYHPEQRRMRVMWSDGHCGLYDCVALRTFTSLPKGATHAAYLEEKVRGLHPYTPITRGEFEEGLPVRDIRKCPRCGGEMKRAMGGSMWKCKSPKCGATVG